MKRLLWTFLIITLFVLGSSYSVLAHEERAKGYYSLMDFQGHTICRTGMQVSMGDEYLNDDNRLYRVVKIEGDIARVKFVRRETLRVAFEEPTWDSALKAFFLGQNNPDVKKGKRPIAIYYTHTDESYAPSDGRSSILGRGGIFKVGTSFADKFRNVGVPVIDNKTRHDPHDAMAYDRSRRTAVQLLKRRPIALLDVHRDAVPPQEYRKVINNNEVTKVRIVIGRQNPNKAANEAFAKQVKAVVDRKYPGMVRGIYYGKGTYNQDLAPRALLLEFGSNTNTRGAAERGAQIFASAAASVLTNRGANAPGSPSSAPVQRGAYKALFWILGLIVVGGIGFILLNSGLGGLGRIGKNVKDEFTGALGTEEDSKDHDPEDGNKV